MSKFPPQPNSSFFQVLHHRQHAQSLDQRYATYEQRKGAWISQNPGATPAEYEAAMNRIKRTCGV